MLVEALEYMGHRAYTGPSKAELVERRLPSASLRRTGGKVLRQIEEAYGTAGKAKELAAAIEASTKLARAFLKDTSEQAKLRRKGTRITLAWLAEADSVAEKIRKTGSSAAAVIASTAVSQAEVDYWDGINLRPPRARLRELRRGSRGGSHDPPTATQVARQLFLALPQGSQA